MSWGRICAKQTSRKSLSWPAMYPRECPTKSRIKTFSLVMFCMARFYKNASLYQHFNPLKMELLFAIIIGFIGTAVSYSTFWGAVAFFCILSFRMG